MRGSEKKFREAQANLLYWEREYEIHKLAPAIQYELDRSQERWEEALLDLLDEVWMDSRRQYSTTYGSEKSSVPPSPASGT